MERKELFELLKKVESGQMTAEQGMQDMSLQPDMLVGNYADIDLHRHIRQGMPEVIYGEGKTAEQILGIAAAMKKKDIGNIMITRLSKEKAEKISSELELDYREICRIGIVNPQETEKKGKIALVAAGTSDLPVAEEAALTAEFFGDKVDRVYDVGVAGIHRLFGKIDQIRSADVIIVIAGMEGALASVVGGLVEVPVIAVPTSVGYGASFGGLAALLSMLNSCANGIGVVNIDNGYGAACLANKIMKR